MADRTVGGPVFTIRRAGALRKRFRVRFVAGNNEQVWYTQTYASKSAAREAVLFLKRNAHTARTVDQT